MVPFRFDNQNSSVYIFMEYTCNTNSETYYSAVKYDHKLKDTNCSSYYDNAANKVILVTALFKHVIMY